MRKSYRKSGRFGFTLIELLVVISIIALLISILLPSLGRARVVANAALDSANQQQIGRGMHLYAADNNTFAPMVGGGSDQQNTPGGNIGGNGVYGWMASGAGTNTGFATNTGMIPYGIGVLGTVGDKAVNPPANYTLGASTQAGFFHGPSGNVNFQGYIGTWDVYFNPNDRLASRTSGGSAYSSFWVLRRYIGSGPANAAWNPGDPELTVGPNGAIHHWGVPSGANHMYESSYSYRGADYNIYNPAVNATRTLTLLYSNTGTATTSVSLVPTNSNGQAAIRNLAKARTDSPYWASKTVQMNTNFRHVDPTQNSVNVLRGDGSVTRITDPNFFSLHSTVGNWNSGWTLGLHQSKRFALMDYTQGW